MGKGPDYDKEVVKHYVRIKSWISPFKKTYNRAERLFRDNKRDQRFKYLTFCAKNAIDVFLLEKEGLLYRDPKTKRLVNVFFCEEIEEDFVKIEQLIGSESQGFKGKFEDLLFNDYSLEEDDDEEFKEIEDAEDREKLRLKYAQEKLFASFPYDVINLDVYGNPFPKKGDRYSDQCKMFKKVLELQKGGGKTKISKFVMYLTVYTPITESQINTEAGNELKGSLYQNLKYQFFKDGLNEVYGTTDPNNLDFHIQYTLGFLKKIILPESYNCGWKTILTNLYCYDREFEKNDDSYKMSCYVLEFQRDVGLDKLGPDFHGSIPVSMEDSYKNEIESFIGRFPKDAPSETVIHKSVKDDLKATVEYRERFLRSIEN